MLVLLSAFCESIRKETMTPINKNAIKLYSPMNHQYSKRSLYELRLSNKSIEEVGWK